MCFGHVLLICCSDDNKLSFCAAWSGGGLVSVYAVLHVRCEPTDC